MSNTRWIPGVRDGDLIKFCRRLQKKYLSLTSTGNLPGSQVNLLSAEDEVVNALVAANGFSLLQATFQYGGLYFVYSNSHGQQTPFSKIDTNFNQNVAAATDQTNFLIEVGRFFAPNGSGSVPLDIELNGQRLAQTESYLSGAVERFEELQTSFIKKNQDLREQHEKVVAELTSKQEAEYERHLDALKKKEDELSRAKQQLDDRSNTHARRDIRKEIKSEITSALDAQSSSKNVENKRWWLRLAYYAVIALSGALALYSLHAFNLSIAKDSTQTMWVAGIKAAITSVSFVAVALLYLKWENSWLSQQAKFELTLAATKVDIDRASWITESLLEWNRENPNQPIPIELLQNFSRRLFDWEARIEDHHTASDSLASAILGSAAKLQIGPSGANVEIDRKGLNTLSKS
jgi:hypothetical protein